MIIGLTGGIASGKSVAAEILKAQNAYVIDADAVYRDLSAEGKPLNELLKKTFPDCVNVGKLDKTLIYNRVFNNPSDRELLNKITHPSIVKEIQKLIKKNKINAVEAALLFESGFDKMCDITVCLIAPVDVRIKRLLARSRHDEATAKKIIASQSSDGELIKKCDYVIHNDGDYDLLKQRVEEWWKGIIAGQKP